MFSPSTSSRSSSTRNSNHITSNFSPQTIFQQNNDPDDAPMRIAPTTSYATPTSSEGTPLYQQFTGMPITLMVVSLIYILLAPICAMLPTPYGEDTGQFLVKQLTLNSSLLIILSLLYGVMVMAFPGSWVERYQTMLLPASLVVLMWIKCYVTYQQGLQNYCTEQAELQSGTYSNGVPYMMNTLTWNTAKVPIAILAVYLFVILFPQTMTPFFQFFSGDEEPHKLIMYFAIGFWTGCAAWASEASCYFQLMRSGCRPFDSIQLQTINQVLDGKGS